MPAKRRKTALNNENEDLDSLYASITELLLVVKPNLAQAVNKDTDIVVQELHDIARLAETFTTLKASQGRVAATFVDRLDMEGVGLWNAATYLKTNNTASVNVFAAARYAGFRLIEAGMNDNPSEEVLVHILELSSKVGMAFATAESAIADEVLTSAASYQRSLCEISIEDSRDTGSRARAIVLYYTSRMDAAWKQGNIDVAIYMMQQIENHQIELMSAQDVELVIGKLMEIGKSIAKGKQADGDDVDEVNRAISSLVWMVRAFTIVDGSQNTSTLSPALKRMILRSIARSYFISSTSVSGNLDKAEEALKELARALDGAEDPEEERQQLRWMSLAVNKKKGDASNEQYLTILLPLIDNITWSEQSIQEQALRLLSWRVLIGNSVLMELQAISKSHFHVTTQALEYLLSRTLQDHEGHQFADKMLISLIMHMKISPKHQDAITNLKQAFDLISASEDYQLERLPSIAALTILWQNGDRYYSQKSWENAADWFVLSTHPVFEAVADIASSKCRRKAALSYIQNGQYAQAATLVEQCPVTEAASCYLGFLVAAHQGNTDKAIHQVGLMIKAKDFDRKMLLMATNFAREAKNRPLLHSVLKGLLETLRTDPEADIHAQGLPLIRCLVRLVLQMLEDPGANLKKLVTIVLQHFQAGNILIVDAVQKKKGMVVMKDLSWLWRTAYNSAVKGLGVWDDGDVTEMFVAARNLMDAGLKASPVEPEPDLHENWIMASFASISGRVFKVRLQADTEDKKKRMEVIATDIERLFEMVREMHPRENNEQTTIRLAAVLHLSIIYQAEVLSSIGDWDRLLRIIQLANDVTPISITTYEAIADILWSDKSCPVAVLFSCLEATLRATTQQGALSVKKFSRWLRAICSILLSRGRGADRGKALAYMQQAIDVLRIHGIEANSDPESSYPEDERHWLISTAFNTGVEIASGLQASEARQWFEVATMLCQFVKDSPHEKIEETYQDLLSRYTGAEIK